MPSSAELVDHDDSRDSHRCRAFFGDWDAYSPIGSRPGVLLPTCCSSLPPLQVTTAVPVAIRNEAGLSATDWLFIPPFLRAFPSVFRPTCEPTCHRARTYQPYPYVLCLFYRTTRLDFYEEITWRDAKRNIVKVSMLTTWKEKKDKHLYYNYL